MTSKNALATYRFVLTFIPGAPPGTYDFITRECRRCKDPQARFFKRYMVPETFHCVLCGRDENGRPHEDPALPDAMIGVSASPHVPADMAALVSSGGAGASGRSGLVLISPLDRQCHVRVQQ